MGDRVINVIDYGKIPVGFKGTVIGMDASTIDICWDFPVMGGTSFNGLCSPSRGTVVNRNTVLNLTNPQPPRALSAPMKPVSQRPSRFHDTAPSPGGGHHNLWNTGAPTADQMSSLLKNMLHIGNDGPEWKPPTLLSLDESNNASKPVVVFDASWQPSMPVPVSVQPEQYDAMAQRLLSILNNQTADELAAETNEKKKFVLKKKKI
jgi:hypothetical protein